MSLNNENAFGVLRELIRFLYEVDPLTEDIIIKNAKKTDPKTLQDILIIKTKTLDIPISPYVNFEKMKNGICKVLESRKNGIKFCTICQTHVNNVYWCTNCYNYQCHDCLKNYSNKNSNKMICPFCRYDCLNPKSENSINTSATNIPTT